jgi:hypothetical protein
MFSRVRQTAVLATMLLTFHAVSAEQGDRWLQEGLTLQKRSFVKGSQGLSSSDGSSTMLLDSRSISERSSLGQEFIVFYGENRLVTINHNNKTYSETTFDELQNRMGEIESVVAERAAKQQKRMEEAKELLSDNLGEITLTKEGPSDEIAGFATQKYRLKMPPVEMLIWAAPELKLPDAYYDMLKLHAVPNPLFDMGKMFEAFKEIDGLSLKTEVTVTVMGMVNTTIEEVTEVTVGPIPEPVIPADFAKVEIQF